MRLTSLLPTGALLLAVFFLSGCPITLVERTVEAPGAGDVVTDNWIMADLGTVKASTEIYERRLLVAGVFDDEALYWHVTYMGEVDRASAGH